MSSQPASDATRLILPSRAIMRIEIMALQEYVEEREGGYYLAGSRVSLASLIFAFREGASPETIRRIFHLCL
jgi:hypothetical protein